MSFIIGNVTSISSRKRKLSLVYFVGFLGKRRFTMITSPNSFSKPSIRKHSCFEKLFVEANLHQHQQEKLPAFSSSPPSPSRRAHPKIYTCICFFLCFFITMAAFLRCNNLEVHEGVSKASAFDDSKGQDVYARMEKPVAMPALRGLGSVYRKGTKAMSELVVAHVEEGTSLQDLRLFLRTLHRSGVTARADIVFIFAWDASPSAMVDVIHEENLHFDKLMHLLWNDQQSVHTEVSNSSSSSSLSSLSSMSSSSVSGRQCTSCWSSNATISPFNINAFRKSGSESELSAQPLWGVRNLNVSKTKGTDGTLSIEWGSIVGFDASELNPDDALQGFIDGPPLVLRRWACYQMLLGMVRRKFKHILLTDVSGVAILRDPFITMVKKRMGLYLSLEDRAWGASFSDELGIRLGELDAEPDVEAEHGIALRSSSDSTGVRRQLYVYGEGSTSSGESADANLDEGHKNDMPTHGLLQDQSDLPRRKSGRQHVLTHRKSSGGRRRRGKRATSASGGLYERVYGRRMWSSLEENERKKKLVNSAVIMGSLQQIRGLANTMVTEIVKVALERKNREAFPDSVLISYLLHMSTSVLGKRVVEHLHLMDNSESFVHCLVGSQQPSFFFKKTRAAYPIIHGNSKGKRWGNVVRAIQHDLCSSPTDAIVYSDCSKLY